MSGAAHQSSQIILICFILMTEANVISSGVIGLDVRLYIYASSEGRLSICDFSDYHNSSYSKKIPGSEPVQFAQASIQDLKVSEILGGKYIHMEDSLDILVNVLLLRVTMVALDPL